MSLYEYIIKGKTALFHNIIIGVNLGIYKGTYIGQQKKLLYEYGKYKFISKKFVESPLIGKKILVYNVDTNIKYENYVNESKFSKLKNIIGD